jgi:hypothetical protein
MISPADERVMETPAGSADGEMPDMTQRTVGRFLAGAALAVTLTFAGAAPAGAASRPFADGLWSQLAEFLADLGVAPGSPAHLPHGGQRSGAVQLFQKAGPCIDPNGHTVTCASSQTSGAGLPRCAAWNDAGGCIDPNG